MSGVTGIVEKPLEGAKTGQFGGFLGGLGKGLLGVVTKPTAGLVDFTSQSLEGIRKLVQCLIQITVIQRKFLLKFKIFYLFLMI